MQNGDINGPVAVVVPNEEMHGFNLNVETLEKILLEPDIADKKVNEKIKN